MSEWRERRLGDVLTLQRGFDITKKEQRPGPIPVVSSSGVTSTHSESRAEGPGVVIGRKGSLGTTFFVRGPFWPHDTTLWVKDFKGNDPFFCYLLVKGLRLSDLDAGSSNPTLNRNHVHMLKVGTPSVVLQRRIAHVLAAFDQLIEINERRIDLLEDLTRSLYQEWFVHFRFPGHEDVEFVDSELGSIPERWEVRPLCEVASVNRHTLRGRDLPASLRYLDISAVGVGQIGEPVVIPATSAPGRARRELRDGDVVWATVRPNRRAHGLVHDPSPDLIGSTGLAVLSPETVPSSFLFEYASDATFTEYLVSRATGSAYPAVRPSDFERALLVIPDRAVMEAFDGAADKSLRLASSLVRHNRALAATRDLLLPRLVTGRLDISDVDLGDLLPADAA
jgi:type I restriction enzyme S subunit